jgi:hypothetical protein
LVAFLSKGLGKTKPGLLNCSARFEKEITSSISSYI